MTTCDICGTLYTKPSINRKKPKRSRRAVCVNYDESTQYCQACESSERDGEVGVFSDPEENMCSEPDSDSERDSEDNDIDEFIVSDTSGDSSSSSSDSESDYDSCVSLSELKQEALIDADTLQVLSGASIGERTGAYVVKKVPEDSPEESDDLCRKRKWIVRCDTLKGNPGTVREKTRECIESVLNREPSSLIVIPTAYMGKDDLPLTNPNWKKTEWIERRFIYSGSKKVWPYFKLVKKH